MNELIRRFFGVRATCPRCGHKRRLSVLELILSKPPCPECGLRPDQMHVCVTKSQTTVSLPGWPAPALVVFLPTGFLTFIAVINGGFGFALFLIAAALVIFRLVLRRCANRRTLLLKDTAITLNPGSAPQPERVFPCGPGTNTEADLRLTGKQTGVFLKAGCCAEQLSRGLQRDQWQDLLQLLDAFIAAAAAREDPPGEVLAAEFALSRKQSVDMRELPLTNDAVEISITANPQITVSPTDDGLKLSTQADFQSKRHWPAAAGGLVITGFILIAAAGTGLDIWLTALLGLVVAPFLALFHAWIIRIDTHIHPTGIQVCYAVGGIPIRRRKVDREDVYVVTDSWFGGLALATRKGNIRIAHAGDAFLKHRVRALIERYLDRHGWVPKPRFTANPANAGHIVVLPAGTDVMLERMGVVPAVFVAATTVGLTVLSLAVGVFCGFDQLLTQSPLPALAAAAAAVAVSFLIRRLLGCAQCHVRLRGKSIQVWWELFGRRLAERDFRAFGPFLTTRIASIPGTSRTALQLSSGQTDVRIGSRLNNDELAWLEDTVQRLLEEAGQEAV